MKTVLFTHNDLDGVSCGIIARLFFGDNDKCEIYNCDYDEIDSVIYSFINSIKDNKEEYRIIISDISYKDKNISDKIIRIVGKENIYCADHHISSMWLNDIFGDNSDCREDGDKCGCAILYELLKRKGFKMIIPEEPLTLKRIESYINVVNLWDTWGWVKDINLNLIYKNKSLWINNAMYALGTSTFISSVLDYFKKKKRRMFTNEKSMSVDMFNMEQCNEIKTTIAFRKFGTCVTEAYGELKFMFIVMTSKYQSLTSLFANEYRRSDTDFILLKCGDSGSMRYPSENIDLSVIAKEFGGGGHKNAAGFNYSLVSEKFKME